METNNQSKRWRIGFGISFLAFALSITAFIVTLSGPFAAPSRVVVAFDTAGGTPVDLVTLNGGGRLSTLPSTSREGFTFEHWLKGSDPVTLQTVFNANTTLRANFTAIEYTITYQTNGGTPIDEEVVAYNASLRLPMPVKTDAIFQGWFTNELLSDQVESDSLVINRDYTFYAKWSTLGEDVFTVSFFSEGLGLIESRTVAPGTSITLPTPTRENYAFLNWVDGLTFDDIVGNAYTINQDAVLFAKWQSTAGLVTITFDSQGGTSVPSMQLPLGSNWVNPETVPFLAEGYQFLSWITNCNFDGFEVSCTTLDESFVVEGDMEVLAKYDYMIPLSTMRFETYSQDGRIIGYRLASIDFFSDTVIPTIILPARFSGLPVVSIGEEAFDGVDFIERVIVPENIQFIEYGAFRESSIVEIFLPETLKKIHGEAFRDSSLETIHFPTDIQLKEIHEAAFRNSQLTSIALPRTVEYIGGSAFRDTPITSVNFPLASQLNYLGQASFSNTLLTNVTLPEGLRSIRSDVFENTATLTSIYIPSTVTNIGAYAFAGTGLTSVQFGAQSQLNTLDNFIFGSQNDNSFIPLIENASTELVIIGPILAAYKGTADNNQPLVIPEGVRAIVNRFNLTGNAFIKSSLTLPSTLQFIGEEAFESATINNDLLFPNMYEVDRRAFQFSTITGTMTFQDIIHINSNAFYLSNVNEVMFNPTNLGPLVDFSGSIFAYATINTFTMGEGYLEIPSNFTAYSAIKHMFFPDSIRKINYWSIGSSNLETLTFAGTSEIFDLSSQSIQLNMVRNSPWYTSKIPFISIKNYLVYFDVSTIGSPFDVTIPDGITAIGQEAFAHAQNFSSLLLNDVTFIANNAFYNNNVSTQFPNPMMFDNLTFIGGTLTNYFESVINSISFGDNIQFDIDQLSEFYFSQYVYQNSLPFNNEGFKILGNMLLQYDPNFDTTPTSVIIPNQIEIIADNAFYEVKLGGPLTLNQNLKWIRQYSFYYSEFVGGITLPEGLLKIDYGAFQGSNLTSITIPASVTNIQSSAFDIETLNTIDFVDPSNLDFESSIFGYIDGESIKNVPTQLRKYLNGSFLIIDGLLLNYFGYQKEVVIPEGVVTFSSNAFDDRDATIQSIVLPSTARYFRSYLFSGLEELINVDFSKVIAINYLGQKLFASTRIRDVTITASILEVHPYVLNEMPYLETYELNLVNDVELYLDYNIDIVD